MKKKIVSGSRLVIGTIACLLLRAPATASENWLTKASNSQADVVLHWVHLKGGIDTVQTIDVTPKGRSTRSLKVTGQPVFNGDKTLAAFPSCATDGCDRDIQVVDLVTGDVLPALRVPESNRARFTCSWREGILQVSVEPVQGSDAKSTHEFPIAPRP